MQFIKNFIQDDDGVTAIEYALIAALIAVAIIAAVDGAGEAVRLKFIAIAAAITNA